MKSLPSIVLLLIFLSTSSFGLQKVDVLKFKAPNGHVVMVYKGGVWFDDKKILKVDEDEVMYVSKYNGLIVDHGVTFLFLAMDGKPNLDRMQVFVITSLKATMVADAIVSPVKDYDGDRCLEFGGSDLTEGYTNPDSMYYIPTSYYQIKNGHIWPDKALTRAKDIAINGLYLSPKHQLNNDGNCCIVIPKPKKGRHK